MVRGRTRVLGALVVLGLVGVGVAPAANADDAVRTQPYTEALSLPYLRDAGLTGKGVTIAVIDGLINLDAPELAGADITVHDICPVDEISPEALSHGTSVTSLIVSPDYGIAPEAKINFYPFPIGEEKVSQECKDKGGPNLGQTIHQAITDGADIISFSFGGDPAKIEYALMRAAKHGIPVVVSAGNNSTRNARSSYGSANITIGVGASDGNGMYLDLSNTGESVTVSAPGSVLWHADPYPSGEGLERKEGTSAAAPLVSGYLAIAMQKWPEASGNQITRLLIDTAALDGEERNDFYGYGLLSPPGLIDNDPTSLEDTPPLLDKGVKDWTPNATTYADYADGLILPTDPKLENDSDYLYRGDNELMLNSYPNSRIGTSPRFHH